MENGFARRAVFWFLDFCRGGKIRQHYNDVKYLNDNILLNINALESILAWSSNNVKFYSKLDNREISHFPIIDKNIIKESWDDLHAAFSVKTPVHHMSTSGSTGTPFTMDWDMNKRYRHIADLIYFNEKAGHKLGQKNAYCRVWNDHNRKSKFDFIKQNLIPIDITRNDNARMELILKKLSSRSGINLCLAYASFYELLYNYLRKNPDRISDININTLVSGSEVLTNDLKYQLKKYLDCSVIDRYSNEENGIIAQSGDCSDLFNVNTASYFVEVLSLNCDEPVGIGESGRIVLTDLYNRIVPVIRYDTGDIAIKADEKDGWVTQLKTIQGRRVDSIYDADGNLLSPIAICNYMWGFDKIRQFQLIQEGPSNYLLKLNGAEDNYIDEEILLKLKEVLGINAKIKVEHVKGIPSLQSGKFKKTICKYKYNPEDYK